MTRFKFFIIDDFFIPRLNFCLLQQKHRTSLLFIILLNMLKSNLLDYCKLFIIHKDLILHAILIILNNGSIETFLDYLSDNPLIKDIDKLESIVVLSFFRHLLLPRIHIEPRRTQLSYELSLHNLLLILCR